LGDSEVSSVQSSPRNAIPEFIHFVDESGEVAPLIGTEEPRDIFQHQPPRSSLLNKVEELECEA
jgi:hypothetical protein